MMNLRKYKHNQNFIKTAVVTHNFHWHKCVGLLLQSQRATTWPRAFTIKQVTEHTLFTQTTPSTSLHTNVTKVRQHCCMPVSRKMDNLVKYNSRLLESTRSRLSFYTLKTCARYLKTIYNYTGQGKILFKETILSMYMHTQAPIHMSILTSTVCTIYTI